MEFSKNEPQIIAAALNCHIRRMKRDYQHKIRVAEECAANGQNEKKEKIVNYFIDRERRIYKALKLLEKINKELEGAKNGIQ